MGRRKKRYFSKELYMRVEKETEENIGKWVIESDGKEVLNGIITETYYVSIKEWTTTKKPKNKYFSREKLIDNLKKNGVRQSVLNEALKYTKQLEGKCVRLSNDFFEHYEYGLYDIDKNWVTNKKHQCRNEWTI